jgi:hypothetical protein
MSGFRDKQRTLVNTVDVPGDAGLSPGKSTMFLIKFLKKTKESHEFKSILTLAIPSEGYAAHPVGCISPLKIEIAV